jgi:hypothetical protein
VGRRGAGLGGCLFAHRFTREREAVVVLHQPIEHRIRDLGPSLSLGTTLPNEINNLGDYSGVYGTTVA